MIAAWCDMFSFPFPALLIGWFAGAVSILSYNFLKENLENAKYYDTRGIIFFHGIPALFGGLASAITCATL